MCLFVYLFILQDLGSTPSSPNVTENPLDAAVKARRKDKDEEQETEGTAAYVTNRKVKR